LTNFHSVLRIFFVFRRYVRCDDFLSPGFFEFSPETRFPALLFLEATPQPLRHLADFLNEVILFSDRVYNRAIPHLDLTFFSSVFRLGPLLYFQDVVLSSSLTAGPLNFWTTRFPKTRVTPLMTTPIFFLYSSNPPLAIPASFFPWEMSNLPNVLS